ncbi:hypothetical protein MTR67_041419 [Solanum verrucosum]|uniref:Uncharacterized protein n=1 Tax=Solanum verrucosum TaxID=315347 RepID=A0AAF0U677_SOLVR|nr:hypothetical protein MTR67_033388 [Solanum verrucosum]WMV48034.1 hypothetical protein MTR67_041419 [Solanum verrucosum]
MLMMVLKLHLVQLPILWLNLNPM